MKIFRLKSAVNYFSLIYGAVYRSICRVFRVPNKPPILFSIGYLTLTALITILELFVYCFAILGVGVMIYSVKCKYRSQSSHWYLV